MKKVLALILALLMLCLSFPAMATMVQVPTVSTYNSQLRSLTHNCTNTGIMLPEKFDPNVTTYLLTVASWVSRPTFTPTAYDSSAYITVNGKHVRSGSTSEAIQINDKPTTVLIQVTNGSETTTYTIYIQRRPSDKRTRVSAGFINSITLKDKTWYLDADLVTMKYQSDDYTYGSTSTYTNSSVEKNVYKYAVAAHCELYYGSYTNPIRATNIYDFMNNYALFGSSLYKFVYIEDEIVAIFPYKSDYVY